MKYIDRPLLIWVGNLPGAVLCHRLETALSCVPTGASCLHLLPWPKKILNCEFLLFMQCLFPMVNRMCLGNISSNTVYFKNQSFLELWDYFLWYNQRLACLFFLKAASCARCGIISSGVTRGWLVFFFFKTACCAHFGSTYTEKKDCFSVKVRRLPEATCSYFSPLLPGAPLSP